ASDNGTEFTNNKFKRLLINSGIIHQLSPAYTHEPNGFIERINRTILNKARSLLFNSNTPLYLWGEAVLAATYLYNRTPHSALNNKTLYELKYNSKPNISNIRVWGSITYYKNKGSNIKKLEPKANKGILIGYSQNQYRIWDFNLNKPIWSRDVKILENQFEFNNNLIKESNTILNNEISLESSNNTNSIINNNSELNTEGSETSSNTLSSNTINNNSTELDKVELINPEYNSLDSSLDDSLDELALVLLNNSNINNEPNTYKQAIESINKQDWINAMNSEIKELENQKTWNITELPPNKIPLRGKWVYKIKKDNKGLIIKYKARWVIKGFN